MVLYDFKNLDTLPNEKLTVDRHGFFFGSDFVPQ